MKMICVGRNYAAHALEMDSDVPQEPMLFMKPATALAKGPDIIYPEFTSDLHYELEVVLFIDKGGKNITMSEAPGHFRRIGLGIDFTARDIQAECKRNSHPWEKAKAFDGSAVVSSPVNKDGMDLDRLSFRLERNGRKVQDGSTADLIFSFDQLIHDISRYFSLEPGDLIFTGTPAGVGPVKPGDQLKGWLQDELCLNLSIIQE